MGERSLRNLFHLVKQALPEEQELVCVSSDATVSGALELMRGRNISQVPVTEGREVLGVFSFRSLARGLAKLPRKPADIGSLPVEEFLEDLHFASITDELTALLDELDIKDAVLVGRQDHLQGIITAVDALRYFYRVASPYVLLREVELAIRELLRRSVTPEQLCECIDLTIRAHYEEKHAPVPRCLEDMSLNDYVWVLRHKGSWPRFQEAFGGTADTTYAKLRSLPDLRNEVFHFRRELTVEEYERLRETRDWLLMRIRKAEARGEARDAG